MQQVTVTGSRVSDIEAQGIGYTDIFNRVIEALARVPCRKRQGRLNRPVSAGNELVGSHRLHIRVDARILGVDDVLAKIHVFDETAGDANRSACGWAGMPIRVV